MGSAIASDSRASARTPNALTNVRTALGADAIATALIEICTACKENCHGRRRATTGAWRSPTAFATG